MILRTPLYDAHVAASARMVPFGGWDMPLHYGSQIVEHQAVRSGAGVFDVSHMTIIDIDGPQARQFLQTLVANDVGKLGAVGQALYGALLNGEVYNRANWSIAPFNPGAVPEPASWTLLIAGFGLTGVALRRVASTRRSKPRARCAVSLAELPNPTRPRVRPAIRWLERAKPCEAL